MKIKIWIIALTLALAAWARGATNDLTSLLQQGLFEEEANRNLDAAIADYQSLASAFDKDRQLAATAVFRLGECYRKLGKTNEAAVQYERIVKEFNDQQTLVTLSQQNLVGLEVRPKNFSPAPATGNDALNSLQSQYVLLKAQLEQARKETNNESVAELFGDNKDLAERLRVELSMIPTLEGMVEQVKAKNPAAAGGAEQNLSNALAKVEAARQQIFNFQELRLKALGTAFKETRSGESLSTATESEAAPTTDEEQTQIRNIQAMIQNSPDLINAAGGGGSGDETPLQFAASKGQLVVGKYLLDHGADVNKTAQRGGADAGGSPLYLAAYYGHKSMVELLLASGADVNGARGPSPLYAAVSKGFSGVADVLLSSKADVNARGSDNGKRVLETAVLNDRTNLIQSLIEHGADVNATDLSSNTPLHFAANGRFDAAQILIAAKADVDARDRDGNTPLHIASTQGSDKIVSLLCDSGASVDATNHIGTTPLLYACVNGRDDVVRVLLAHKANPNLNGRTDGNSLLSPPIAWVVGHRKTAILQMLLDAGANPNGDTNQWYPIFSALNDQGAPDLKLLLQHGADSNPKQREGLTPLFVTTNPELVHLLIEYKADLNARDPGGSTPIMRVTGEAATNFTKILLEAGAKTDLQDTNGNTALHFAVYYSRPESVALLLEHKAHPNIQNNNGYTPLDVAKQGMKGQVIRNWLNPNSPAEIRGTTPGTYSKMAELLATAGGLANLPKRDRIEARRGADTATVLYKDSRNSNHYSLLELIGTTYSLLSQNTYGEWNHRQSVPSQLWDNSLHFPDFKKVVIYRRTNTSAKQTAINVNVEDIVSSGDCSRDVWLEWGDVVEIPEADHPVDLHWPGLTPQTVTALVNCIARQVTIKIKGESTTLKLAPEIKAIQLLPDANITGGIFTRLTWASFMLRSVLDNSKLVRVSSDLSHVKVTRVDPETKKTREWIIDCTNERQADLWLRDGDVIEVPEK